MSYEIHGEEELENWEREHDFLINWSCPSCDYSYEARKNENERLNCPTCKCQTVYGGESYSC